MLGRLAGLSEGYMTSNTNLGVESPAVQAHLSIMQGVIQRMAENSRSCKLWCIALVAATLVLVARLERPEYVLLTLLPAVMFLVLDTYYLALERALRGSYEGFVGKLHAGGLAASDLYEVKPSGSVPKIFVACLRSFSILPFYITLVVMVSLAWWVVGL